MKEKLSQEERETIVLKGYEDPVFYCRFFLEDWFPSFMPWVHRGCLALLLKKADFLLNFGPEQWRDGPGEWTEAGLEKILKHFVYRPDPDNPNGPVIPLFEVDRDADGRPIRVHMTTGRFIMLMMPRGISKTTLVNAANTYEINYKTEDFIVYVSETSGHATTQLGNVKRQLESNELMIAVFGNLVPSRSDRQKWTEDEAETLNGVVLKARGSGQQIRGMNVDARRPSKITVDDVEDKESVKTPEQRKKTAEWFSADLVPALPQFSDEGRIVMLGTLLHEEALMMSVSKDPEWITIKFGAIDPDGEPLAPHYMSLAKFERTKRSFQTKGLLRQFYMEYMSTIKTDSKDKLFNVDLIRFEIMTPMQFVARALALDPAISEESTADFTSFSVVGMSERGRLHVLEHIMKRGMLPREQIDTFFELRFRFETTKQGIEAVAYQAALVHLMREEMFRKGKLMGNRAYFEIEPIRHGKTRKIERVEGVLQPRYAAGYITHQRKFGELELQLDDWPNGKKDGPDSVAMAVTLLDPHAALAFDHEGEGVDALAKDQYEELVVNYSCP